jgi:hypothetical protein
MKDKAVMPEFERMSARFEQDLAALENQIAESEMEKPRSRSHWSSRTSMLVAIPIACAMASLDQNRESKMFRFQLG